MLNFLKCCLCALSCFLSISVFAQSQQPFQEEENTNPHSMRVELRHIENKGVGYNTGYTTLEAFFAPFRDTWTPFLDLRGHVFDNGRFAANVGVGIRLLSNCRIYGLNAYYDYRDTKQHRYKQVSLGFETMGVRWDFRLNSYLPVGDRKSHPYDIDTSISNPSFNSFAGNSLFIQQTITRKSKVQFAMTGGDAEAAYHILKNKNIDFYAAAGPYYYNYKGRTAVGGKVRLFAEIYKHLSLELINSYDSRFHENIQGSVGINIPFGPRLKISKNKKLKSCKDSYLLSQRLFQDVERQEIIVLDHFRQKDFSDVVSIAVDPLTGLPFYFVFVNNTSSSLGTYESPYPTLTLAQKNSAPNDVIYVFPGNGTTQGMNKGIILQPNQKFWGSSTNHPILTTLGTVIIPAQSFSAPQITNTESDIITLATDNNISGFTLLTSAVDRYGIFGVDPKNIEISYCTIDQSQADQIHLEYITSSGTTTLNNLILTNGRLNGVFISSTVPSPMTCTVSNCIIQDTSLKPFDISFANEATLSLTSNTVENNLNSSLINFEGSSTLLVSDNTFINTDFAFPSHEITLSITSAASPLSATITNNTISNNSCGGIYFALSDTKSAQLTLANNIIENNDHSSAGSGQGSAIVIDPSNTASGNCNLILVDNIISGNKGSAVYCSDGNFNDFQMTATGNRITNNESAGFLFHNPCNSFTLTATNNSIVGQGDQGITAQSNITNANIVISSNQITNNGPIPGSGASAIAITGTIINFNFAAINNNLSNNDNVGIFIYPSTPGDVIDNVILKIENNTIQNNLNSGSNASGGFDLEKFTNLSGSFKNNTLSNNGTPSLLIGPQGAYSCCLEISGNNSDTDYVFSNTTNTATGFFNLTPCNVDTVNTGTIAGQPDDSVIVHVQSCPGAVPCP